MAKKKEKKDPTIALKTEIEDLKKRNKTLADVGKKLTGAEKLCKKALLDNAELIGKKIDLDKKLSDSEKQNRDLVKAKQKCDKVITNAVEREIRLTERFEADQAVIDDLKRDNKQMDAVVKENEQLREIIDSKKISVPKKVEALAVPALVNKARVIKACRMIAEDPDCEIVKNIINGIKNYIEDHCK